MMRFCVQVFPFWIDWLPARQHIYIYPSVSSFVVVVVCCCYGFVVFLVVVVLCGRQFNLCPTHQTMLLYDRRFFFFAFKFFFFCLLGARWLSLKWWLCIPAFGFGPASHLGTGRAPLLYS
jgi:hypothetical protein